MTKTISSRERLSQLQQFPSDLISAQQQSDEVNSHTGKVSTQSIAQLMFGELRVVHATPGRIRISANDDSEDSILECLSQQLRHQEGVKEVSTNHITRNLVVTFDVKKLSLPRILAILEEFGIQKQQSSSDSVKNTDPFAAWKSIDFWKEQGISFIPLFTGLGVTSAMGISGLAAIPVYMITADATRWVIDYIEPQLSGSKSSKKSHNVPVTKSKVTSRTSSAKVEQNTALKEKTSTVVVDKAREKVGTQPAKIAYSIVHTIPGRIRLHVPRISSDRAYAKRLERLLKSDSQTTNVRINCDAASVAIAYQPNNIPVSHWFDLMQLANHAAPQVIPIKTEQPQSEEITLSSQLQPIELTSTLQPQIEQTSQPVELEVAEPIPEKTGLWTNFKTPALSYALAFMVNFPLKAGPD